jgi:hypothetical protein
MDDRKRGPYPGVGWPSVVLVGSALGVFGFFKTSAPGDAPVNCVIPLLDKSMKRLWTLAYEEAERPIDRERYGKVNDRFNAELLSVKQGRPTTAQRRSRSDAAVEGLSREVDGISRSIPEVVRGLQAPSAYLDSSGFGLKTLRENDSKFRMLTGKLAEYEDSLIDEELNSLIRCHTEFAEYSANMILAFRRGLWTISRADTGMSDSSQEHYRAELELTESRMVQAGQAIRAEISQHIRQLQPMKADKRSPNDRLAGGA